MKLILKLLVILVILDVTNTIAPLEAADSPAVAAPPVARRVPKTTEINGHKLVDDYFWLRDKSNPDVKAYLEADRQEEARHLLSARRRGGSGAPVAGVPVMH